MREMVSCSVIQFRFRPPASRRDWCYISRMTVTLTPEQMRWLEEAVAQGRFSSVEEAVAVAVVGLQTSLEQDDLSWAKPYLDEAEARIERGEVVQGDEFLKWLDGRIAELKAR